MKIAVATENGKVALHFGRCPEYTIFEVKDGQICDVAVISNPGHRPGFLPKFLAGQGVNCIIAGGMGPRAEQLFKDQNIETVTGVVGEVERVVEDYLKGSLRRGDSFCEHVEEKHLS